MQISGHWYTVYSAVYIHACIHTYIIYLVKQVRDMAAIADVDLLHVLLKYVILNLKFCKEAD